MLCRGGRGPQTACEPLNILEKGFCPSALPTAASPPEVEAVPPSGSSTPSSCRTISLLKGFLALLRLCFFPRFWMSRMATGHRRLPGEALEMRP